MALTFWRKYDSIVEWEALLARPARSKVYFYQFLPAYIPFWHMRTEELAKG
jgi:hypothetical protein